MKKLLLIIAITVPVLLFLNVWQVHRYDTITEDIVALEDQQREWLERNKRMIAGITVFRSPERIERLAQEELDLKKIENGKLMRIHISNTGSRR